MWSHYTFRRRLVNRARRSGKLVIVVNESYTSKTCTRCGHQHQRLGGTRISLATRISAKPAIFVLRNARESIKMNQFTGLCGLRAR